MKCSNCINQLNCVPERKKKKVIIRIQKYSAPKKSKFIMFDCLCECHERYEKKQESTAHEENKR